MYHPNSLFVRVCIILDLSKGHHAMYLQTCLIFSSVVRSTSPLLLLGQAYCYVYLWKTILIAYRLQPFLPNVDKSAGINICRTSRGHDILGMWNHMLRSQQAE